MQKTFVIFKPDAMEKRIVGTAQGVEHQRGFGDGDVGDGHA